MTTLSSIAIFLSAFLLFQVQFILARALLPWFGGGSAIWITCLFFFQSLLPCGYFYAHTFQKKLSIKAHSLLHILLIASSLFFLPILPEEAFKPTDPGSPISDLLIILCISIGVPYLLLSSTAPLIQHWFHISLPTKSPYRLYALSNLGSLLGLVSYPLFFERKFSLEEQSTIWSSVYFAYVAVTSLCALKVLNLKKEDIKNSTSPIKLSQKITWMGLTFLSSILLLTISTQITQNIAAVPFLWALPLCLYLLTFIISFDKPHWTNKKIWIPLYFIFLIMTHLVTRHSLGVSFITEITAFCSFLLVTCMICHGELVRLKPKAEHLTSYYLYIAIGGAIGSLVVAIISPLVFSDYWEYYLGILLSYFLVCWALNARKRHSLIWRRVEIICLWFLGSGILAFYSFEGIKEDYQNITITKRNFYGTLSVSDKKTKNTHYRLLNNGVVTHGKQYINEKRSQEPTTYFGNESGVGRAFHFLNEAKGDQSIQAGLIGLGCGTIAAYGRQQDIFDFYEINPYVIDLAEEHFTYLSDSKAQITHVLGDARISLEKKIEKERHTYDLLVVDAFTSDSIPIHLLTYEAFQLYLSHLKPEGILAIHISNLHLDLSPVVRTHAKKIEQGLVVYQIDESESEHSSKYANTWLLVTRNENMRKSFKFKKFKLSAIREVNTISWTDNFSDLFSVLDKEHFFEELKKITSNPFD